MGAKLRAARRWRRAAAGIPAAALVVIVAHLAVASGEPADRLSLMEAGDAMAAALARAGLPPDTAVGITRFVDGGSGVACQPLSARLTEGFRAALLHHAQRIALKVKVSQLDDPRAIAAVVSGRWTAAGDNSVGLELKLGDVRSTRFDVLHATRIQLPRESLTEAERGCLLSFTPVERVVPVERPLVARESISPTGPALWEFKPVPGATVHVAARVAVAGKERWAVVRLPRDENLPVFLGERFGFVYDLLPVEAGPAVTPLDEQRTASRAATVRAEPRSKAKSVGTVAVGAGVDVTGRLTGPEGGEWYRVAWQGGDGYVIAAALEEKAAEAKPSPAAPGEPLSVKVWTERNRYRAGETFVVKMQGNKDFHARIVYRDAGGNLDQLLPNGARGATFFKGGVVHGVPAPGDGFVLRVGAPFGRESVMVLASTAPLGEAASDRLANGLARFRGGLDEVRGATYRGVTVEMTAENRPELYEAIWTMETAP